MDVIYLDFNATTPCDPRVVAAMSPFFSTDFANPASRHHGPGRNAFMALEKARTSVARSIGARSATEIVFTSGATESNNLAIRGVARAAGHGHLVTQATEHPAVAETMQHLEASGFNVTVVAVGSDGLVAPEAIAAAIRPETILVSVMLANNETGVVQPMAEIAAAAHDRGVLVHCDAAQAPGKLAVDVDEIGVDLLSLSGHKCYGPKGSGALYIRRTKPPTRLVPLLYGGGHEHGLRSGTTNLPAAFGFSEALRLSVADLERVAADLERRRDRFEHRIAQLVADAEINGAGAPRLPNTSNISFPGVDGEALMASLPDLAVSTGSACASAHPEPSRVLLAMGRSRTLAASALRISLGRTTTDDEVDRASLRIGEEVARLRKR